MIQLNLRPASEGCRSSTANLRLRLRLGHPPLSSNDSVIVRLYSTTTRSNSITIRPSSIMVRPSSIVMRNVAHFRSYSAKQSPPLNPALQPPGPAASSVGAHKAPPKLIYPPSPSPSPFPAPLSSSSSPQSPSPSPPGLGGSFGDAPVELGVGEITEGKFRIEPLRRQGEDVETMRARLTYQSRKRGILEADLLLSTFAHGHLGRMGPQLLEQYDRFLDENDWDIYYWATQQAPRVSVKYAEGGSSQPISGADAGVYGPAVEDARPTVVEEVRKGRAEDLAEGSTDVWRAPQPANDNKNDAGVPGFGGRAPTEWAQTVGRSREPYRPPPSRWKDSEILRIVRAHVQARKQREAGRGDVGGLGKMPDLHPVGKTERNV